MIVYAAYNRYGDLVAEAGTEIDIWEAVDESGYDESDVFVCRVNA